MRTFIRTILQLFTLGCLIFFGWTLYRALFYSPEVEVVPPPLVVQRAPINHAATSSLPARLIIPSLGVNAYVRQVGLKADGSMATPGNFTDVAWYKYGTIPGQLGSAVIDGHVDNGLALAGVFKHLEDLKVGDDIYIKRQDGTQLHFVVDEIQLYPYESAPDDKIFQRNDAARLNLITCGGDWLPEGKTYDHRLVIFSRLVQNV